MRKVPVAITNFAYGEVSPSILSRTDTAIYQASLQRMRNLLIRPEGGAVKRGGLVNTYEFDTTYDSTKTMQCRLIPFIFSDDEQYIVSIEHQQVRMFQIDPSDGSVNLVSTLTQDVDTNTLVFSNANMHEYTFTQSGDVMFICHRSFLPQQLVRTGATSFQVEGYAFDTKSDGNLIYQPYFPFQSFGVTLDPSASTGSGITLTTSSAYFDITGSPTAGDYLDSTHVNVYLRYGNQEIKIVSVQSATSATGDIIDELYQDLPFDALETFEGTTDVLVTHINHGLDVSDSVTISKAGAVGGITAANINGARTISEVRDANSYVITAGAASTSSAVGGGTPRVVTHAPTLNWSEQCFSAKRGYPGAVTLHENRLVFGGSTAQPDGIWLSKSGYYYNFDVGTGADGDSIQITAAVGEVSQIRHLISNRDLQIFGASSELYIPAFSNSPLTPTNAQIRRQTNFGCNYAVPQTFDGGTLFLEQETSILREYIYTEQEQAYISSPVSTLSQHLISNPIELASTHGTMGLSEAYTFVLNDDGTLAVFSANRGEGRAGWFQINSAGTFHSVVAIGNRTFANVVFDTGAGTEKIFLCEFDVNYNLDMAKTYIGTAGVFVVSGDFANGAVLDVISGNNHVGQFTVTAGNIDVSAVDDTLTSVEIGYDYDILLRSNPIDVNIGTGPVTGRPRGLGSVFLDLYETMSVSVNGTALIIRRVTDDLSIDRIPVTAKKEFRMIGYSRDPQVEITQNAPLHVQVNGFVVELII